MPEFVEAVKRVHRVVGNAVTEGRYVIGGTGSSQLFLVALRALASSVRKTTNGSNSSNKRIPVFYKEAMEQEKSELYEWQGDANTFKPESNNPYIEVVTSPNNPDGRSRKPVVKGEGGVVMYDLAYYWPQYTPITSPADYDVMLFTLSKTTGHAGSRMGWAIVKDQEIAKKMKKQICLTIIGSCQEGQFRATKILQFVADRYEHASYYKPPNNVYVPKLFQIEGVFDYGHRILAQRWEKLRAIVQRIGVLSLPDFSPGFCNFFQKPTSSVPAFAWVECKTVEDAEQITKKLKIKTRIGSRFGSSVSERFIRVSMMGDDHDFNLFLERLSSLATMELS
ncbi:Tryptophan aminotransferase-related protein 1 [Bienertia sinuspersici]